MARKYCISYQATGHPYTWPRLVRSEGVSRERVTRSRTTFLLAVPATTATRRATSGLINYAMFSRQYAIVHYHRNVSVPPTDVHYFFVLYFNIIFFYTTAVCLCSKVVFSFFILHFRPFFTHVIFSSRVPVPSVAKPVAGVSSAPAAQSSLPLTDLLRLGSAS